jgi:diguanylate cyclase (GGDEF)-like protein/PAS domain S-box-containing protein
MSASSANQSEYYQRASRQLQQTLRSGRLPDLDESEQLTRELEIYRLALQLQQQELDQLEQKLTEFASHEREQLEALRTNARILEASQAIAKVGGVEMHVPTRSLYWTAETYRIHDTTPEEFTPSLDEGFSMYLPGSRERIAQAMRHAIETGEVFDIEVEKYTFKGRKIDLRTTCTAHYENGTLVRLTGIYQDITERKQAERRYQHHNHILEMLLAKIPLDEVLSSIVCDVEELVPGAICSILLTDESGTHLTHGAAPNLPDFYVQAINGASIGPAAGSCGTAAFLGERVVVEDIDTHPYWRDYHELAAQAGLRSCWSQPIFSAQGKVLGTFAIYHREPSSPQVEDLRLIESEARLSALAIEQSHVETRLQLAASVFTHAREGIFITDLLGNIIEVNQIFSDITGYTREEVIGKNPRLLKSGLHGQEFYASLWHDLEQKGYWHGELWNRHKNGKLYATMMTISAVQDGLGHTQSYVNLFTDITPIKEHQRQLEYIAHYDALTGLPNRVLLADRLKQAISHSHRQNAALAVLYIDLDGFKAINDQYGHDTGDQLLVNIAHRLKATLREGDTIARIGGDEFVVVMTGLEGPKTHELVLERLLHEAATPLMLNEQLLQVSASIGATLYPQDAADADQLLRHADQAMYIAKQAGKNGYHLFDVAKDIAVKTQRESLEHIRSALDKREFVLFYQPKVNMRSGEIIGVEALVRWQHPQQGLIPPIKFLPVIEDHPLSIELGDWVIDEALSQIERWQALGLQMPVSVNVGALQLQRSDFAARLAEQLLAHPQVPPAFLELEIVETSALKDIAEVADLMRACCALGVHFAVDDFGTGYSSLTYLKRLPADLLKIDQTFVRDMLDDPDDLAIVKGVIGLANAFHRRVIAEGVETIAHGELLIPLGCELAQGYGIARPMPASDLPRWAAQWQPDPAWRKFTG